MDTPCNTFFLGSGSSDELLNRVRELASPGENVTSIRLVCNESTPNSIFCMVDTNAGTQAIADSIGGFIFGNTACASIHPIAADFRCANRHNGKFRDAICSICQVNANASARSTASRKS